MLMRLFNSIDLIGYGGDINQSESCKGCVRHIRWWGKNQDFMLIRLFNSIDLIGCGGDINQSEEVHIRHIRGACKVHKRCV